MSKRNQTGRAARISALCVVLASGAFAYHRLRMSERPTLTPDAATSAAATLSVVAAAPPASSAIAQPKTAVVPRPAPSQAAERVSNETAGDADSSTLAARMQAGVMIPALLLVSVEEGNLDRVRELREELGARSEGDILSAADFEALDLVLDCADQAPYARTEAMNFLASGGETVLTGPLRSACGDLTN